MNRRVVLLAATTLAFSNLAFAQTPASPQQTTPLHHGQPVAAAKTETGKMNEHCQAMAAHMQERKARMAEMDARLDQKLATMNAATGNAKVDAMAAVLTELVSQRKEMHQMMEQMQPEMMHHMMEHMSGKGGSGMGSMANCPAMQQMNAPPPSDTSAGTKPIRP